MSESLGDYHWALGIIDTANNKLLIHCNKHLFFKNGGGLFQATPAQHWLSATVLLNKVVVSKMTSEFWNCKTKNLKGEQTCARGLFYPVLRLNSNLFCKYSRSGQAKNNPSPGDPIKNYGICPSFFYYKLGQ